MFDNAEGLEAGKTQVKYRNVEVGLVDEVALSEDLSHIVVTASLDRTMEPHMKEGTRFWIVRPRVGFGGVSGLGTLLSGAYVEFDPGEGQPGATSSDWRSRRQSPQRCQGPSSSCAPIS